MGIQVELGENGPYTHDAAMPADAFRKEYESVKQDSPIKRPFHTATSNPEGWENHAPATNSFHSRRRRGRSTNDCQNSSICDVLGP